MNVKKFLSVNNYSTVIMAALRRTSLPRRYHEDMCQEVLLAALESKTFPDAIKGAYVRQWFIKTSYNMASNFTRTLRNNYLLIEDMPYEPTDKTDK